MPIQLDDTIAAIASPPGAGPRGIIRISGPQTAEVVRRVFLESTSSAPPWHHARVPRRSTGKLWISDWEVSIDTALMYWPTRRSFTGQPMAELHLVGSMPVLNGLLEELWKQGARPAERGEFTMRSFLNGRIDLLQAEAVLGVIDAANHEELRRALSQLGGGLTNRLSDVRQSLIGVLGDLEAGLDFVEEDIEFISKAEIARRLLTARETLQQLAQQSDARLSDSWKHRVVLAGLPNAGKSTLFNALAGEKRALVSPVAGTTRDYLTAEITVENLDIELVDTAGWEDVDHLIATNGDMNATDQVITNDEAIMGTAQRHRGEQMHAADLILWCQACNAPDTEVEGSRRLRRLMNDGHQKVIDVHTQTDRVPDRGVPAFEGISWPQNITEHSAVHSAVSVSALTGRGLDELRSAIAKSLQQSQSSRGELLATTSARCRDSLRRAIESIESAMQATGSYSGDELISLDIRTALHELGTILGTVYTDDILDHIFSKFCIGK